MSSSWACSGLWALICPSQFKATVPPAQAKEHQDHEKRLSPGLWLWPRSSWDSWGLPEEQEGPVPGMCQASCLAALSPATPHATHHMSASRPKGS